MLLQNTILIKINSKNFNYYKNFIEEIRNNQTYEIDIKNILPSSHSKVRVMCKVCNSISEKPYREYMSSFNKYGLYSCSPKCAQFKNKITNSELYGFDNVFQSQLIKDKIKETNLNRYEVEYPSQSKNIRKKIEQSYLERYGTENPAKSELIQEKIKNTCFEKYGSYNYNSSEFAKRKRIQGGLQVPDELKTEFELYLKKVRNKTNRLKKKLFETWNGLDFYDSENIRPYLECKCHDKKYPTIDHKISIYYGFTNNIDPEVIGDLENLCITKRSINSSKNIKCF